MQIVNLGQQPDKYAGIRQMLAGMLQGAESKYQQKLFNKDMAAMQAYLQQQQGQMPDLRSQGGQQLAGQLLQSQMMSPLEFAAKKLDIDTSRFNLGQARTMAPLETEGVQLDNISKRLTAVRNQLENQNLPDMIRNKLELQKKQLEKAEIDIVNAGITVAYAPEAKEADIAYKKAMTEKALEPTTKKDATLSNATVLRKEFNQSKARKDFMEIDRSEKNMKAALEMSKSADTKSRIASDQALGVLFQKMLDPTSVVRESEYARTPEGASALSRVRAIIPQLRKGGMGISDEDRQALYDMAAKFLDNAKVVVNKEIERYTGLAQDYGVDPNLVLGRNVKPFSTDSTNNNTNNTAESYLKEIGY